MIKEIDSKLKFSENCQKLKIDRKYLIIEKKYKLRGSVQLMRINIKMLRRSLLWHIRKSAYLTLVLERKTLALMPRFSSAFCGIYKTNVLYCTFHAAPFPAFYPAPSANTTCVLSNNRFNRVALISYSFSWDKDFFISSYRQLIMLCYGKYFVKAFGPPHSFTFWIPSRPCTETKS